MSNLEKSKWEIEFDSEVPHYAMVRSDRRGLNRKFLVVEESVVKSFLHSHLTELATSLMEAVPEYRQQERTEDLEDTWYANGGFNDAIRSTRTAFQKVLSERGITLN